MSKTVSHDAAEALLRADDLLKRRKLVVAEAAYNQAERMGAHPDECSSGRWQVFMLRGDIASAALESDAIRSRGSYDVHRFWDGTDISNKRVIVRCLHGYGDTIQMLQYLPLLLAQTNRMILEVQPRLLPLLRASNMVKEDRLELTTWGEDLFSIKRRWDVQLEVMELPYVLRTDLLYLPAAKNYLTLSLAHVKRTAALMGCHIRQRVGLVWTAGDWNTSRIFPVHLFRKLFRHSVEFWSLVEGKDRCAMNDAGMNDRVIDSSLAGDGILSLAAVICNLDLVITTDTLAAHLAGASGIPVWVMLPHAADWRWLHLRTSSPWYPSMQIFRQSVPGEWSDVLQAINHAMQRMFGGLHE